MREKFYYLRKAKVFYPKNLIGKSIGLHRCGIVFLVEDKGIIARGTSLCNEVEDPFLKDEGFIYDKIEKKFVRFIGGLKKAKRRALQAFNSGQNHEKIKLKEAKEKVAGLNIEYKSEYMPVLNPLEQRMFFKEVK